MEAILVSPIVRHARMCQRLMQAAGSCSARSVVASCSSRAVGTVPVRHFRPHSTFFPSLQPAGIVRRRFHRALMQSEFLGTQFRRSFLSFSIALERIQRPGLASIWTCSRHVGRSAAAITSPDQSRKMSSGANPFKKIVTELSGSKSKFYSLPKLGDKRVDTLPYSIRILLESAIRNCDNFQVMKEDVEKILDWEKTSPKQVEIPFKPARVILQDFTGVPCVVDLAAMRDAIKRLGGDPNKINPLTTELIQVAWGWLPHH